MAQIQIMLSNIVTAFETGTTGTKVLDHEAFETEMFRLVEEHEFPREDNPEAHLVKGQAFIPAPTLVGMVSSGDCSLEFCQSTDDFVVRKHRGEFQMFARRSPRLPPPGFCALIVYTIDAYIRDPDVIGDPAEAERAMLARDQGISHVLVAVLGSSGPKPQLSPYRLVANMAGGNLKHLQADADTLRKEAAEVLSYADSWITVAD